MNVVLLLTATVTPQVKTRITLKNPQERLAEYANAVNWYYKNTPYKIVIGENSGFGNFLDYVKYQDRERIEYICYKNEDFVDGPGWNEWEILKRVKLQSRFIREASYVMKVTGRLILTNIRQVNRQFKHLENNFFCGDYAPDFMSMNTRFFVFTPNMFNDIIEVQKLIGKYYVEICIMDFVYKQYRRSPESILYFKYPLFISGRGGHYGNTYDTPFWKKPLRYIWKIYKLIRWKRFKRKNKALDTKYNYFRIYGEK